MRGEQSDGSLIDKSPLENENEGPREAVLIGRLAGRLQALCCAGNPCTDEHRLSGASCGSRKDPLLRVQPVHARCRW
jgi:hypothetical protein